MHPDLCFTLMQISVLLRHNMAAIRCLFQTLPHTGAGSDLYQIQTCRGSTAGGAMVGYDIAHFTHSKNLDNMMDKLQQLPD